MVTLGHHAVKGHTMMPPHRPGHGVHIQHHMDAVSRTGTPGLHVDDGPGTAPEGNQVGLPTVGGSPAPCARG